MTSPTRHPRPPDAAALAAQVAASLTASGASGLRAALQAAALPPAAYEASVRGGDAAALRAGRMMIERASGDLLAAIAAALAVPLPTDIERWLALAAREGLPLIVGWDRRGDGAQRCVKLYLNASDAARATRARVRAALLPGAAGDMDDAAVIGLNARADGVVETKCYLQAADAVALAARLAAPRARALAAAARAEGADAGGVLSYDVDGAQRTPRAFFVALREPPAEPWACVQALPGYTAAAVAAQLPFAPAPPRSLGVALGHDVWTLYHKPRHSGRAPQALEPVAIFRSAAGEVGVFVEPSAAAARAFRRTARHAISIRVRAGAPEPRALEALVDWFTARVRHAEAGGAAAPGAPPAPWQTVCEAPLATAEGT